MTQLRVLLADDQILVAEGVRRLLEGHCQIVGTIEEGLALIEAVGELQPDVVILEIGLPLLNGLDAGRRIKQLYPHVKLIYLTMYANATYVNEAMDIGASGYLLKRSAVSELVQSLEFVGRGHCYLTPLVTSGLLQSLSKGEFRPKQSYEQLTVRQREVLQLVSEGFTVKEIARLLKISPKTVAFHKANLMTELQLRTTAALTRYALEQGLMPTVPLASRKHSKDSAFTKSS